MITTIISLLDETPGCICSATLEEGQTLCRKCHARERWLQRRAAKGRTAKRRGESRRPAGRPRNITEAGVIWT
ncbi:hypothetical protein GCM10010156_35240 [Planobispora rosea]|uniref:Uncharacterized protein n=1 Tax=Planobispora rosea TaxID=35762 RepID=A0A8J3RX45_PLARO|nr:hypothetical protein [Planobispora rosea]GGS73335.1 hypothetical protein GCM10010156_35240 [Planobispora rosea]GIH81597.1 hypothetical protein Pro02_00050 [Planobispora rosea]